MKITSTGLAWVCVALLVLNPVLAILVWAYLAPDSYGILAALLAANAGTAVFAGLVFSWPEFSHCTSRELRLSVSSSLGWLLRCCPPYFGWWTRWITFGSM